MGGFNDTMFIQSSLKLDSLIESFNIGDRQTDGRTNRRTDTTSQSFKVFLSPKKINRRLNNSVLRTSSGYSKVHATLLIRPGHQLLRLRFADVSSVPQEIMLGHSLIANVATRFSP